MPPQLGRWTCVALMVSGLLGGCQAPGGKEAYPKDPLLMSKKPVEGADSRPAPQVQLVSAEPMPPPFPTTALATLAAPTSDVDREGFAAQRNDLVAQPVATPRGPVPATAAVRSAPAPLMNGIYGHAPDHVWLQGVLDKHYHGHFDLRYCDHTEDDSWGGKVCLENDPRLAQFQDGDVVRVDGELMPAVPPAQRDTWSHYPRYRVRSVQLIQHKK